MQPYQNLNCRVFDPSQLVQNFDINKFQGRWFVQYISKYDYPIDQGSCKVSWIQTLAPVSDLDVQQYPALKNIFNVQAYQPFIQRDLQIQYNQLTDKFYRGLQNPAPFNSSGIIWNARSLVPSSMRFHSKYQVLSTDYENYAIVYGCALNRHTSQRHGDENILIYTRNRMGKMSSDSSLKSLDTFLLPDQIVQSQIENEFIRLFSPSNMTASTDATVTPALGYKKLSFMNDLQRISQNNCETVIPDSFNFQQGLPLKFTSQIRHQRGAKQALEDDQFVGQPRKSKP